MLPHVIVLDKERTICFLTRKVALGDVAVTNNYTYVQRVVTFPLKHFDLSNTGVISTFNDNCTPFG